MWQDFLEALKYHVQRKAFRYYTVWSCYFLIVAMVLAVLRMPWLLPAATVNVAMTSILGFAMYAFAEDHQDFNASIDSGITIYTKRHHITRRMSQFLTHVMPLFLAFLSITILLPATKQPHPIISFAIIIIFSTVYMGVPEKGLRGLNKAELVYGEYYLQVGIMVWVVSSIMLWGLYRMRLRMPICPPCNP